MVCKLCIKPNVSKKICDVCHVSKCPLCINILGNFTHTIFICKLCQTTYEKVSQLMNTLVE